MLTRVDGINLCDLTNILGEINLSQRGVKDPKPLHVEYTYDSVLGTFSVTVELVDNNPFLPSCIRVEC